MLSKEQLLKADQELEKITDDIMETLKAESNNPMTIEEFCKIMKKKEDEKYIIHEEQYKNKPLILD